MTELARLSGKTAFEIASCYRPFLPHLDPVSFAGARGGKPPGGNEDSERDGPEGVRDRPGAILPVDTS